MHILYLVPYTPTPIRTRPYNLIRGLMRRGHALTLATTWETEAERRWLAGLAGEGLEVISARLTKSRAAANMLGALASSRPLQSAFCWQPALMRAIEARRASSARAFDVIHLEHLRGARYGQRLKSQIANPKSQNSKRKSPISNPQSPIPNPYPPPPWAQPQAGPGVTPILWDSVDCISRLFEQAAHSSRSRLSRWVTQFELARTRRSEASLARHFDRVLVSSAADRAVLERLAAPGERSRLIGAPTDNGSLTPNPYPLISVLPNGVDLEYFTPRYDGRALDSVVFTGKMSYHANVTAALHLVDDVMPQVWARRPAARVEIVGQAPPAEVRALAERYAPRVSVTGFVPDVRPHLWLATIAAAPIVYGAGVQNKVLEAMACATPVAATPQAVEALEARDGEHVLVSAGAEAMAANLLRLMDDDALRRRLGEAGRRYVTEHHRWGAIAGLLEGHYRELVGAVA